MIAKAAAGTLLAVIGTAMVFFGVGFAGYAIYKALTVVGEAGAAALTALALLFIPMTFALVALIARPRPSRQPLGGEGVFLSALSSMARDKPLLALLAAGLFGGADIFLSRRRNRR